jgi:hypothetical protein
MEAYKLAGYKMIALLLARPQPGPPHLLRICLDEAVRSIDVASVRTRLTVVVMPAHNIFVIGQPDAILAVGYAAASGRAFTPAVPIADLSQRALPH